MARYRGTTLRAMRVGDDVWASARARADEEGTSVTAEVVAFLQAYGAGEPFVLEARKKPRRARQVAGSP